MASDECRPPDPGGGVCCQKLESKLRSDFEERIKKMEDGLAASREYYDSNMSTLKEMIEHRNEILLVKNQAIEERDAKIQRLSEELEKLGKKIKNNETKENSKTKKPTSKAKKKTENSSENNMSIFKSEPFPRFFHIKFDKEDTKRRLCPFKLELELTEKIANISHPIQSSGKDGLMIEVSSKTQGDALRSVEELCGHKCSVQKHDFFNVTKGLVYIYNNDITDLESFKEGLNTQCSVVEVVPATWIKARNPRAKVFQISFGQDILPEYVHIPGEYQETKVYEYKDRPMQCTICQKYGHNSRRCRANQPTCGNCGGNHNSKDCEREERHCCLCDGAHSTRSQECPVRKEEEEIMAIQKRMKLGKVAARAVFRGDAQRNLLEEREYVRYIDVAVREDERRRTCPYKIQKFMKNNLNVSDDQLNINKNGYTVKSTSESQTNKLLQTKQIAGMTCSVTEHKSFNESKGLIYLRDLPTENEEYFAQKLTTRFNLKEAVPAKWIKCNNPDTKPYLLTFNQPKTPLTLTIPGQTIKVNEYKSRPLFCTKCLCYGHSKNRCDKPQLCRICTAPHDSSRCPAETVCLHCKGSHRTGDRNCKVEKENRAICDIQHENKVSWIKARNIYNQAHPRTGTFAEVASRSVPSTSDVKSKRTRQSDSEEDIQQDPKFQKIAGPNATPMSGYDTDMSFDDKDTSENHPTIRRQAIEEYERFGSLSMRRSVMDH